VSENARGTYRIVLVRRDTMLLDADRHNLGVNSSVDATIEVQ